MTDNLTPAEELADRVIGTASRCYPEEELETAEQVTEFEALAFECGICGWWCSTDELNNETHQDLCDECAADHGDD